VSTYCQLTNQLWTLYKKLQAPESQRYNFLQSNKTCFLTHSSVNFLLPTCLCGPLKMSSKSGKFLRTLPSGVKLYLRDSATNGSWRRVPGLSDEEYFSKVVGDRVNEEIANQKGNVEAKTGTAVDRVVIEYATDGSLLSQKLKFFFSGTDSTKARAMWCLTPG
jgi:hypothetical protein